MTKGYGSLSTLKDTETRIVNGNRLLAIALVCLLTLLAAAVRMLLLGESLWVDELHTSWTVYDGLRPLPARAAMGNNSPAYFLLPWLSSSLFGAGEWQLRLPSLLAGTVLVPLSWWVVSTWTGERWCGLLAAWLAACDANFMFYAVEARTYAIVQLLALVQLTLVYGMGTDPTGKRRIAFVLVTVMLFYLHYSTVLLLPMSVLGIGIAGYRRGQAGQTVRRLAVDMLMVVLMCLPAIGHVAEVAARKSNWDLFVSFQPVSAICSLFPLGCVGIAVCGWAFDRAAAKFRANGDRSPEDRRRMAWLLFVIAWMMAAIVSAWALTNPDIARLFLRRYLIGVAIAPPILVALFCAEIRSTWFRVTVAAVVLLATVGGFSHRVSDLASGLRVRAGEDWRGAVELVNRESSGRPVFVHSGLVEADALADQGPDSDLHEYCLLPVKGLYQLQPADRLQYPLSYRRLVLDAAQVRAVQESGGAWFLLRASGDHAQRLGDQIRGQLQRHGLEGGQWRQFPFGRVSVLELNGES